MNEAQRSRIEHYLSELAAVAQKAEELQGHVDEAYKELLQAEIQTYRELIAMWRKRIHSEASGQHGS